MDGNEHAHNMESDGMDEWTQHEDREADQRCPEICFFPGCEHGVEMAISLGYASQQFDEVCAVHPANWTPWTHWCMDHGQLMEYYQQVDFDHLADIVRAFEFVGEEE